MGACVLVPRGKRNPAQQYSIWDKAARHYPEIAILRLDLDQIARRLRLHIESGVQDQLGYVEAAFFDIERIDFVVHRYVGNHEVIVGLHREATAEPQDALDRLLRVLGTDRRVVEATRNSDGAWITVES